MFKQLFTESNKDMLSLNKDISQIKSDIKNDKDYIDYTNDKNINTFEFKNKKVAKIYYDQLADLNLNKLELNDKYLTASI